MVTFRVKETATGKRVMCSRDIYESMKELARADQESFWVLGYNARRKEIFRKCLFVGGISDARVDSRLVFNRLLACSAASWAAVHNHPGGSLYPSPEDNAITEQLQRFSEVLGFDMVDHLIVGDDGYYSFADNHWKTLGKGGTVEVTCKEVQSLRLSLPLASVHTDLKGEYHYPDVLFFPLGDSYEAYFKDAKLVSKTCGFPLDCLDSKYYGSPISVCRVPNGAIQKCIEEITKYDIYRVAIVREVLRG